MLLKTVLFSFVLIVLSLLALSIGLIITGKPKLKKGCGTNPHNSCDQGKCDACSSLKTK